MDLLKIKEERRLQRGGPQDRNPGATLLVGHPPPQGVGIFCVQVEAPSSPEREDEVLTNHLAAQRLSQVLRTEPGPEFGT